MSEAEFLALIKGMTEAEQAELLDFMEFLLKCRDEGRTITRQEARKMGEAARDRIASQQ